MCICVAVITTQRNKKPLTVRFNTLYRYHGKTSEGMLILSLLTNTKEEGNAVEVPSIYDGREITVRKNLEAGDLCTMIDYTGSEPSWNEKVLTVYIPTSMQGQLK
jgi:hypothetical protein